MNKSRFFKIINFFFKTLVKIFFKNKILSLILLLAAFLRLMGFIPGYAPYHSDEGMAYSSAIEMIKDFNLDPDRYDYPSLIPLIHALIYAIILVPFFLIFSFIFIPERIPPFNSFFDLWGQFLTFNQVIFVLPWARFITGLFGIAVVYLTYLVSIKYFQNKKIGLVAAFLTAVNYRQVLNSHFGLPDIYNAFFLLLNFYIFSLLIKNPSFKNYALSGLGMGLYFSTKFQSFTAFSFILIHSIQTYRNNKNLFFLFKKVINSKLIVAILLGTLVVLFINQAHLINWEKFRDINSYNLLKYGFGVQRFNIYPVSYLFYIGIGPIIFILCVLGVIYGLVKYTFKTLIFLSYLIPYLYIFIYYSNGGYYTRNFVSITPILLIFAGLAVSDFWDFILSKSKRKSYFILNSLFLFLVFFICFDNLKNSVIASISYTKPWSFQEASNWSSKNIPDNSKLVSHTWDKYPRDKNFEIISLDPAEVFSVSEMLEEGAEYGYINIDWLSLGSYWWMNSKISAFSYFWGRPDNILANTYSTVISQEIASYTIAPFVKPWQAPEMNILVIKLPDKPNVELKDLVDEFTFDSLMDMERWSQIDDSEREDLYDPEIGHDRVGSIRISERIGLLKFRRVVSGPIKIEQNKCIFIEGWIKSENDLDKKSRDGLIRVDFYSEDPGVVGLGDKSLYSSMSSRYFGNSDWKKKEIVVVPPANSNFAVLSIGHSGLGKFWFDDIKVFQSRNECLDPRTKAPYIDYRLPDDILFPYSQGGL